MTPPSPDPPLGPAPLVSVLIPTWNGEAHLARLLPALRMQALPGGLELRVTDSSSDDGTQELLRSEAQSAQWNSKDLRGLRLETISRADFHHGRTRNELARQARGEFLVFLSQDALPQGEDFLQKLLLPFDDERVAGVTARVLPQPSDDPLTQRTVLADVQASSTAQVRCLEGAGSFDALDGPARLDMLRFNNVASAIRTRAFREFPFPDVDFGEDFAWAARVLNAGWKIAFEPQALVLHSHRYGPRSAFERYRVDAQFHANIHRHPLRPSLASAVRGIGYEVWADLGFVLKRGCAPWHLLRSPGLRIGQVLGQWRGSRIPGRDPQKPSGSPSRAG